MELRAQIRRGVVSTPTATQPASARRRNNATNQQLDELFSQRPEGGVGDIKSELIRRWRCTNSKCSNHEQTCWLVNDQNDRGAHNHRPVYKAVFEAWAASIRAGQSTVDEPSIAVVDKMAQMKAKGFTNELTESNRHRPGIQQGGGYINFAPVFTGFGTSNTASTPSGVPPSSSPPRWTNDTEVDVTVEVSNFFDWLSRHRQFRNKPLDLIDMRRVIIEEKDLGLVQLYKMTVESWTSAGLKEGQKSRVNKAIKEYCDRELDNDFLDLTAD
ncbi:MAG: hypothetical protein Q9174_007140 [Haloplaca sp. 1 TL-2023]